MRRIGPACIAGLGVILGACSSMTTYGTGKTAAQQTVEDLGGILSLGAKKNKEPPIDYEPRAPIVEPPSVAGLPPPGSETTGSIADNWPRDPDEEAKRQQARIREVTEAGKTPKFTVPEGAEPVAVAEANRRPGPDRRTSVERLRDERKINNEDQKKLFAEAKMAKSGSFDAQGRPIRRYLTEPPVTYREPDAASPVVITEKPKRKFQWPDLWPF